MKKSGNAVGRMPTTAKEREVGHSAVAVRLCGVDKVTALLLAMGKTNADKIIRRLDNAEIRRVAEAAAALRPVTSDILAQLTAQLQKATESGEELVGSVEEAENLLAGVLPEDEAIEILSDVRGDSEKLVWQKITKLPAATIARLLSEEHPQLLAFVISRLPPTLATEVLATIDNRRRADVGQRMLMLREPSDAAIELTEQRLSQLVASASERDKGKDIGVTRLSAILNKLDDQMAAELLRNLEQSHPDRLEELKKRLFRFENITALKPSDRVRLFESMPVERTILALRGAPDVVRQAVLQGYSPRARRMIEQELSLDVSVAPSSISEARGAIVDLALSMAEAGTLDLTTTGGGSD